MMNETMIKKMEELLKNEEFAQKIKDAGSYENMHKLFVENGVDVTREDFMAYIEDCRKTMVEKGLMSEDGELSVELLEAISGGGPFLNRLGGLTLGIVGGGAAILLGASCGVVLGIMAVGSLIVVLNSKPYV